MDLWPMVLGNRGVHLLASYQFPVDLHDWQKSLSEDRQVDIIFGACRPTPTNRLFKKSRFFCATQIRLPRKANILGGELFSLRTSNNQIIRELQFGWKYGFVAHRFRQPWSSLTGHLSIPCGLARLAEELKRRQTGRRYC